MNLDYDDHTTCVMMTALGPIYIVHAIETRLVLSIDFRFEAISLII